MDINEPCRFLCEIFLSKLNVAALLLIIYPCHLKITLLTVRFPQLKYIISILPHYFAVGINTSSIHPTCPPSENHNHKVVTYMSCLPEFACS